MAVDTVLCLGLHPFEQKEKVMESVSDNWLPTVWQGTVSGLWLGAVAAVCLICLLKSSTQSCRSCLWVQITCRRSNIVPAKAEAAVMKALRVHERLFILMSSYHSAQKHFYVHHSLRAWTRSCQPEVISPAD